MNQLIAFILVIYPMLIVFMNGITTSFMMTLLIFLLIIKKIQVKGMLNFFCFGIILFIVLINIYFAYHFEESFIDYRSINKYAGSLILMFLILDFCTSKKNMANLYININKFKNILLVEVILIIGFEMWYFVTGKGFISWWNGQYFAGSFETPHPISYMMLCLIIIMALLSKIIKNWSVNLLYIPIILFLLYSGARTPAISGIILLMLFIIYELDKKYIPYYILMVIAIVALLFFSNYLNTINNIPFLQKFLSRAEGNEFSGRDVFWMSLLSNFKNFDIINKIFGNGIFYTRILNYNEIGNPIWGHNDVLDVLISLGLIVVSYYFGCFINYFSFLFSNVKKGSVFLLILAYSSLIFFNGFFSYSSIVFSIPYITIYLLRDKITNI